MDILYISIFINCLIFVNSYSDSESVESNRIEVTPFYDTIIYSDIADIIRDFENNGISPLDIFTNSESQSSEKVEDLLTEYQHYLEKAHKQKKNYIEKSKSKNKVPLLRHDKFSKKDKPVIDLKHNEYFYSDGVHNPGTYKLSPGSFNNPLDLFIPINSKGRYVNKVPGTTNFPKGIHGELLPFEKIIFNEKKILNLPPAMHKSSLEPIKSSCFCKNGHIPCDCNCKQCLIHFDPFSNEQQMQMRAPEEQKKVNVQHSSLYDNPVKGYNYATEDNMKELPENMLNIRIKVDLQLPRFLDNFGKYYKTHTRDRNLEPEDLMSKEMTTAIRLPFPYFNFPLPIDALGFKKPFTHSKADSMPIHKITIHKKKKSKTGNNNKKHRKKIIAVHNIKPEQPQPLFPIHIYDNITDTNNETIKMNTLNDTISQPNLTRHESNLTSNRVGDIWNDTQTEESVYLIVNITNNLYNNTENTHKLENSIETDITKIFTNQTTTVPTVREKRDISNVNVTFNAKDNTSIEKNNIKKSDKELLSDEELLYWPTGVARNILNNNKKNITTIILEGENKKTKLNMSKETIRHNHTRALEQAIFGDVDWDDIDTVVPAFMSFVGKYVSGMLTFCSEHVCHSMKCSNKTCLHRVCIPADRLNNRGHCVGSNSTDSIASMESIMDLPSNIAFEVVDILQDKLLGKIFGKATFCINPKCITLVTSKKVFVKSRCTIKELNATGHCVNAKTVKIM